MIVRLILAIAYATVCVSGLGTDTLITCMDNTKLEYHWCYGREGDIILMVDEFNKVVFDGFEKAEPVKKCMDAHNSVFPVTLQTKENRDGCIEEQSDHRMNAQSEWISAGGEVTAMATEEERVRFLNGMLESGEPEQGQQSQSNGTESGVKIRRNCLSYNGHQFWGSDGYNCDNTGWWSDRNEGTCYNRRDVDNCVTDGSWKSIKFQHLNQVRRLNVIFTPHHACRMRSCGDNTAHDDRKYRSVSNAPCKQPAWWRISPCWNFRVLSFKAWH